MSYAVPTNPSGVCRAYRSTPAIQSGSTWHRGLRRASLALLATLPLWFTAQPAAAAESAESYPSKPIHLIVPFTAGGLTDRLGRTIAQEMSEAWNQPVIVENRSGAGGTIGAEVVSKAAGDGYTLLLGTHATHAINVTLLDNLPYDAVADFEPVTLLATVPSVLVVHPSVPVKSLQELIDLAKKDPGKLTFSSQGIGTSGHMAGEHLKSLAGIDLLHVPARGPVQALGDVVGGHTNLMFESVALSSPMVESGKLKALAVTSRERSPAVPNLPTMDEAGVPGYEIVLWFAVYAGKDTPEPIINKLSTKLQEVLRKPAIQKAFVADGVNLVGNTPQELAQFQQDETVKWAKLIKATGASANK